MQTITLQMLALHRRRHCIRQQLFQRQQRRLFWIWQKPFNWNSLEISRPEVLSKKDVPRNFTKFTGKHLSHPLVQVFSCEFCEIFKDTILHRAPLVAASARLLFDSYSQLKYWTDDLKRKLNLRKVRAAVILLKYFVLDEGVLKELDAV